MRLVRRLISQLGHKSRTPKTLCYIISSLYWFAVAYIDWLWFNTTPPWESRRPGFLNLKFYIWIWLFPVKMFIFQLTKWGMCRIFASFYCSRWPNFWPFSLVSCPRDMWPFVYFWFSFSFSLSCKLIEKQNPLEATQKQDRRWSAGGWFLNDFSVIIQL